jgi:HSP20 family protein
MTDARTTVAPEATSRLKANVYETPGGETFVIEVPVPGLTEEEIVIEVDAESVTVRTEPRQSASEEGRTYLQREHVTEPMSRIFEFPDELDTDNVRATLENGLLRVRVPRAGAGRRRVIRIGSRTAG